MSIATILLDAGGVLYYRPHEDTYLELFLEEHGYKLRHRSIVERGMRAAKFDVQSGRISRDLFYDAILRLHGVTDESIFPAGRAALLRDAADIELFPGAAETLIALHENGYRLGVVSDTAHSAAEKIDWLANCGIPSAIWSAFVVSSEFGQLKSGRAIFEWALMTIGVPVSEAAFIGHSADELRTAGEIGLTCIAFQPDDPNVQTPFRIESFAELKTLLLGE